MKTAIIVIVCIVGGLGALLGLGMLIGKMAGFGSTATGPTTVRVEPATRGPLVELVSVPGEVEPKTHVEIRSRISGRIAAIPNREGMLVSAPPPGTTQPTTRQVLVELDARDMKSNLESVRARAEAQRAQKDASQFTLMDAETEYRRRDNLHKTQDIPLADVQTAKTRVDELTAQLKAAEFNLLALEAEIRKAEEELSYTLITSPINGTVTSVKSEVGEMVVPGIQGSEGSVILEVADLDHMIMVAEVDETNIAALKKGQRATVRMQAYRDKVFEGEVESVALTRTEQQQQQTRYYECEIRLIMKPGEQILSGLSADAEIETRRHEGIRVPSQAVLGRPVDGLPEDLRNKPEVDKAKSVTSVVYRVIDGKAVVTPVKVGASDETHTLILSGLSEGEPVVTGPYKVLDGLAHGQAVNVDTKKPAAATSPAAAAQTAPVTTTVPTSLPATVPN